MGHMPRDYFRPYPYEKAKEEIARVLNKRFSNKNLEEREDGSKQRWITDIPINPDDRDKIIDFVRSLNPNYSYTDDWYPVYGFTKKSEMKIEKRGEKYVKKIIEYNRELEFFNGFVAVKDVVKRYEIKSGDDNDE